MATDRPDAQELQRVYKARFAGRQDYRSLVWKELARYFAQWIPSSGTILDLGAGYCEFINNAAAGVRYAMDLNPTAEVQAAEGVTVLSQDCVAPWPLADASLDAVFTSNFLEHLPEKAALRVVLSHVHRCLKPGGKFIAMGPNIKYVPGAYWDFFDHYIPLTELSLSEVLTDQGFDIVYRVGRFLPYTMSDGHQYPVWMLRQYLAMPRVWPFFGKQFLIVAQPRHPAM